MAISKIILNGVTQIDLTQDTVLASNLLSPYTAHGADGQAIVGLASSSSGSATFATKSITANGSYSASSDNVDGYSQVTVAVPNSFTISDVNNSAGITAQITATTASGGVTPSMTQHTIDFEFIDSTTASIVAYFDSSFISSAITAVIPTSYNNKVVETASFDNVIWYARPSTDWEVIYDGTGPVNADSPYNSWWIGNGLEDIYPTEGSIWRITIEGATYSNLVATLNSNLNIIIIGNPMFAADNIADDGSGIPFCLFNAGWGAWSGGVENLSVGNHTLKIERQRVWETIFNDTVYVNDETNGYGSIWLTELTDLYPTADSIWKITIDGTSYITTTTPQTNQYGTTSYYVGNPVHFGFTDDNSGCPVAFVNQGYGAWLGSYQTSAVDQRHTLKIEHQTNA